MADPIKEIEDAFHAGEQDIFRLQERLKEEAHFLLTKTAVVAFVSGVFAAIFVTLI